MTRRTRWRGARYIAGAVAVIALGVWWLWPSGGKQETGETAPAGPIAANLDAPGAPAETTRHMTTTPAARERSRDGSGGGAATERPTHRPATEGTPTAPRREVEPGAAAPAETAPAETPRAETHSPNTTAEQEPAAPALALPAASIAPPTAPSERAEREPASPRVVARVRTGLEMLNRNEPIAGRRLLTDVLDQGGLDEGTQQQVRDRLAELNEDLVFGPQMVPGDPFVVAYEVQSGDALSKIPRRMGVHTDWRFIQRINRLGRPEHIRVGQRLKLITGPFHAVITKHAYRMDLYLDDGTDRAFVRSFPVGLGEYNSTPEGRFRVRPDSKLINPEWVNPRTRERFRPDDPANPIGEHWIGLVGDEPHLREVYGYGIHGTIEPDSIGRQASMGCVRMAAADVALVWEMLVDDVSTIEIQP